jgi:hypothetical protein
MGIPQGAKGISRRIEWAFPKEQKELLGREKGHSQGKEVSPREG